MVDIKKRNNNIIIDGIEISIEDYNSKKGWYKNNENAIREEYQRLAKEIFILEESKQKPNGEYYTAEEYLKEAEKTKKVNYNLYYEADRIYQEHNHDFYTYNNGGFKKIENGDDEARIRGFVEFNNEKIKKFLEYFEKILPKLRQVFTQKEETGNDEWGNEYNNPNKDKTQEELQREAKEIEAYRQKAKQEIENALNKDPQITNGELESGNQSWENEIWNSHLALGKREIDNIKFRVLTDIQKKRATKTGQEQKKSNEELTILRREAIREIHLEQNKEPVIKLEEMVGKINSDWIEQINNAGNEDLINLIKEKVLTDIRNRRDQKEKEKSAFENIKNSDLKSLNETQIAEALKTFSIQEGNEDYVNNDKVKAAEEKLVKDNVELFKKINIDGLKERLEGDGIKEEEFANRNPDYRRFVDNKINDIEEFKKVRDDLIKKSGEMIAKSRWQKFIDKAKKILQKAKEDTSKHIQDQIKEIKEQFKSLKEQKNSYSESYQKTNQAQISNLEKSLKKGEWIETTEDKKIPAGMIAGGIGLGAVTIISLVIIIKKSFYSNSARLSELLDFNFKSF